MLGKLASAAELANLPVERLNKYEKDMITELDRELQKEFAVEKGREDVKAGIARAMLADKQPLELVVKYTGLSAEEVLALKS